MIRDTDNPAGARQKLVFEYDHQGRRIRKQYFSYSGGWQEQTDTIFLYDGWNLVAELNADASNARVRTYVWGTDLSGTMQGAGGVGGLLKVTYYGTSTTNAFVAYDGNGNVTALIDAANGSICARYEYGPFAEPIRASGPLSKLNPIRFSTKYTDNESGFLYYGYRYYNPSTGRWLSRDPIEEEGGLNLYVFVANGSTYRVDRNGLDFIDTVSSWAASAASSFGSYLTSAADSVKSSVSREFVDELTSIGKQYLSKANGTWTVQYPRRTKDYYGGALQFFWGAMYRVRVESCCVRVEGGGFAGGRLKGPPIAWLGGARLVGGNIQCYGWSDVVLCAIPGH